MIRGARPAALAAAAAIHALMGIVAARASWHRVGGLGVTGLDRLDGRLFGLAMGAAAFLAGYTLLARGKLLAWPIAASGAAGLACSVHYHVDVRRAGSTIAATLAEVGMEGLPGLPAASIEPAAWVALLAGLAVASIGVAGAAAERARRRG